jgi:hypothetical protein
MCQSLRKAIVPLKIYKTTELLKIIVYTRSPLNLKIAFDLHVLSMSLAFTLSQSQTQIHQRKIK